MDTADGWREDGFDGGIYVVQRQMPSEPGEFVDRIVDTDEDGGSTVGLEIDTQDPIFPVPIGNGEFRVVQRGCRVAPGEDYLVWSGEATQFCTVWRELDPTQDQATYPEALAKAEERFAYVYGAGRVDIDEALAPVGRVIRVSAPGVPAAPVASTRLHAPAAWGALSERLSGLSLAAFDALDFPFFHRLSDFVTDAGQSSSSPIPEFLPEPARACGPLRQLVPELLCTPSGAATAVQALASPDGVGAAFRLGRGALVSGFTRTHGRLDGAGSGAFSFDGGSSLAALHLDRAWIPRGSERWQVDGSLTLAADLPRGLGASTPSLFAAGVSVLSEWSLGLTRTHLGAGRTRVSLAQPPRAEVGHGRFTLPSGRREDGTRLYASHRVSLVPSDRELTMRIAHQRPVRGGDLVLSVHRTEDRGHRPARPEHGVGVALRRRW